MSIVTVIEAIIITVLLCSDLQNDKPRTYKTLYRLLVVPKHSGDFAISYCECQC